MPLTLMIQCEFLSFPSLSSETETGPGGEDEQDLSEDLRL